MVFHSISNLLSQGNNLEKCFSSLSLSLFRINLRSQMCSNIIYAFSLLSCNVSIMIAGRQWVTVRAASRNGFPIISTLWTSCRFIRLAKIMEMATIGIYFQEIGHPLDLASFLKKRSGLHVALPTIIATVEGYLASVLLLVRWVVLFVNNFNGQRTHT